MAKASLETRVLKAVKAKYDKRELERFSSFKLVFFDNTLPTSELNNYSFEIVPFDEWITHRGEKRFSVFAEYKTPLPHVDDDHKVVANTTIKGETVATLILTSKGK